MRNRREHKDIQKCQLTTAQMVGGGTSAGCSAKKDVVRRHPKIPQEMGNIRETFGKHLGNLSTTTSTTE